ncbi:FkbM family methyltransferase [Phnomibacter ginsenosidimutans]|uniref:FkbM family methyltransferase n=1 Tax=Phnomibacter ginsenosidimutans TaxID=2676868 RepID=A0A6I6GAM3_9BACT|nr:FkbM family methyltransferase [Phnomibacter ginsenosidimutans]QGW29697.1 FkbM family methyltransferase [Phnomibacter ginsenosidimutans]
MPLLRTLRFIATQHAFSRRRPAQALLRFVQWQWHARLRATPKLVPWTNNSQLWLAPGLRGATGNHYCGLHEFEDMSFLLHLLRPQDSFADIGANTGTYSILAAAQIGARVYSFEPVPAALHWLQQNINANQVQQQVTIIPKAVSNQTGEVHFTSHLDAMNHVLDNAEAHSIAVPCTTLDEALQEATPLLLKIDVEGNEHRVLQGAEKLLSSPGLKAMIIETTHQPFRPPHPQTTHEWLLQQGFAAYTYAPYTRQLIPLATPHHHNTLYLRDIPFIEQRLQSAAPFGLWGRNI